MPSKDENIRSKVTTILLVGMKSNTPTENYHQVEHDSGKIFCEMVILVGAIGLKPFEN